MSMLHARAAAIEALPSRAVTASELELAQEAVEAVVVADALRCPPSPRGRWGGASSIARARKK